jgi:hypothetical protein
MLASSSATKTATAAATTIQGVDQAYLGRVNFLVSDGVITTRNFQTPSPSPSPLQGSCSVATLPYKQASTSIEYCTNNVREPMRGSKTTESSTKASLLLGYIHYCTVLFNLTERYPFSLPFPSSSELRTTFHNLGACTLVSFE